MRVSIKTPFANLSLEMTPIQAANLVTEALMAALPMPDDLIDEYQENDTHTSGEGPGVSKENQETDGAPPERSATNYAEGAVGQNGYRGFLHIKCERCHKEKSFHIKWPLDQHRCECGHTTNLQDLSEIVGECACGWKMKYHTNQSADSFELQCPSCGEKSLVKWSFRNSRYERVNER